MPLPAYVGAAELEDSLGAGDAPPHSCEAIDLCLHGLGAPSRKLLPAPQVGADDALLRLEEGVREVERASAFKIHPIFGPLSPTQWRQLHWIHSAHHLRLLIVALPRGATVNRA